MAEVMDNWRECRLIDIIELIGGGTPKTNNPDYWNGDIPWLSVADFNTGNKFVFNAEKSITQLGLEKSSTRILNKRDIIISARGTVGVVAILGRDMAFNQSCYGVRANQESTNEFVYYLLKDAVNKLQQISHGGVFDTITRDTFKEIILPLPSLPEQKAIAEVLGGLDDKIDLLHRQNQTLESLAETLFRQWFIEGASEEWKEKPLDEIAIFLNGLACQKHPPKDELNKLPVLKIKDLRGGISEASDWVASDVASEYVIENGDVIFAWSGSLMVKIWDGSKCVLNQHLFKVTSPNFPKWFYYYWTNHHLKNFIAIAETKATTMGHIKRADLANAITIVPDEKSLREMDNKMSPVLEKLILNNFQIRTIETLRNNLLPKLMSGDVLVKYKEITE